MNFQYSIKKLNIGCLKEISSPLYLISDNIDITLLDSNETIWVLVMKELDKALANKLIGIDNFTTIYKLIDEDKQKIFFNYLTEENKLKLELS